MRSTVLFAACVVALTACSKSAPPADDKAAPADAVSPDDAKGRALVQALKQDLAAEFVTTASEACGSVKGQEPPDLKSGSPMSYSAAGVVDWGKGSLNYVKEPGALVVVSNMRAEKTFSFGADIYDLDSGARRYVAGLSQLKGQTMGATVTDETKAANGDSTQTTGNLCVGGTTPPPRITQGVWPLAVKHLQVPSTPMSCFTVGKFDKITLPFSFDGKTLQAGKYSFTEADAAYNETLTIDPKAGTANVVYSISKADESSAGIGLSRPGVLLYAALTLPGGLPMICSPVQ